MEQRCGQEAERENREDPKTRYSFLQSGPILEVSIDPPINAIRL
jgi:hypothetical protein